MVLIYTLTDPRTKEIRYVGKTVNMVNRMARHKRDAMKRGSTSVHRNAWLRSLYSNQLSPIVNVVEEVGEAVWGDRERYHIKRLLESGCNLTNMTDGGEGCTIRGEAHWNYGQTRSADTKRKISIQAKNRWKAGEYDFHALPLDARWGTERANKHRDRMREYNANKTVSDTTKAKISALQSRSIVLVDGKGKVCYTFPNARIAGEALGCSRSNINNRRRDGGLVKDKYKVYYEDEYITNTGSV